MDGEDEQKKVERVERPAYERRDEGRALGAGQEPVNGVEMQGGPSSLLLAKHEFVGGLLRRRRPKRNCRSHISRYRFAA